MGDEGLRQQKKARTRAKIVQSATEAFVRLGYDNTTLEQVAKAAGITKRTLLRYFSSKTNLVLGGHQEALEEFRRAAIDRGGISILDIWEDHVSKNAEWIAQHGDAKVAQSMVLNEPAIVPALLQIQSSYQKLIFDELCKERHSTQASDEIHCAVVAAALVGGNFLVGALLAEREDYESLPCAESDVIELVRSRLMNRLG